jgi:hypothetical protein
MNKLHNPASCFCNAKNGNGDTYTCTCPCDKCRGLRLREFQWKRRAALEARLAKANIRVDDLALLVWSQIEPMIEERIAKLTEDVLRRVVKNMKLSSQVIGSW